MTDEWRRFEDNVGSATGRDLLVGFLTFIHDAFEGCHDFDGLSG